MMPLGTSDGQTYESESHFLLGIPSVPENYKGFEAQQEEQDAGASAQDIVRSHKPLQVTIPAKLPEESTATFVVRHGATDMNNDSNVSADRIRGWKDIPLNEEGRADAHKAAESLTDKGITSIVSSDLDRAKETADIIGNKLGLQPIYTKALRPWNLGKFTGMSTEEAIPQLKKYSSEKASEPVPEGESFNNFKFRALSGVSGAIQQDPNGRVAIVTHHRIDRLLNSWIKQGASQNADIHEPTFLSKGEPPGGHQILNIPHSIHSFAPKFDIDQAQTAREVAAARNKRSIQPEGGRQEGVITNWAVSQGEAIKQNIEDLVQHPENIVGTGELGGLFVGRGIPLAKKLKAQSLETLGFSSDKIKSMLGLERGAEGNWRSEISDQYASLKEGWQNKPIGAGKYHKLEDILYHPELFKLYPEVRDIKVEFKSMGATLGSFSDVEQILRLNIPKLRNDPEKLRSVILHELQHFIQGQEGWSTGHYNFIKSIEALKEEYIDKWSHDQMSFNKFIDYLNKYEPHPQGEYPKNFHKYSTKDIKTLAEHKIYLDQAHEIEARNVQKRRDYTAEQRRIWSAQSTEDIPREEQLISKPFMERTGPEYDPRYGNTPSNPVVNKVKSRIIESKELDKKERIGLSAIKIGDKIYEGNMHVDAIEKALEAGHSLQEIYENPDMVEGYTTSHGRFLTREETRDFISKKWYESKELKLGKLYTPKPYEGMQANIDSLHSDKEVVEWRNYMEEQLSKGKSIRKIAETLKIPEIQVQTFINRHFKAK